MGPVGTRQSMRGRIPLLPLALCLAACAQQERAADVVERDSAGVAIIENVRPVWADGDAWHVGDAPALVVGTAPSDPAHQLFGVYAAVIHDSTIVVANNGTSELRVFDLRGSSLAVLGGAGEGPGELDGLRGVHACSDGRLLAVELRRVSIVSATGDFLRTVRLAPDLVPTPGYAVGVPADCGAIILERGAATDLPATTAVYQQEVLLTWVPLDGGAAEVIATVAGPDLVNVPAAGRTIPQRLPWGRAPTYAVGADVIFVGTSDTSEIRVFGRTGLARIIRWPARRKRVGERDRDLFVEQLAAEIGEDGRRAALLPTLEGYSHVPEYKPAYVRLLYDPAGYLWVREYQDAVGWLRSGWEVDRDGERERWWIFDRTGRWLGSVQVPPSLRVLNIQADYLLAIAFDVHDVERLQLHPIVRGRSSP
jgi:hypothetical protein